MLKNPFFLHMSHTDLNGPATSACLTDGSMLLCSALSYDAIVQRETLLMTAQAEQLHAMALAAVLPVRIKVLDASKTVPRVDTYEPGLPLSRPTTSRQAQTAASAAESAAESAQQVWIMFRPGHYEMVYPAEGYENVDGQMKTWQRA